MFTVKSAIISSSSIAAVLVCPSLFPSLSLSFPLLSLSLSLSISIARPAANCTHTGRQTLQVYPTSTHCQTVCAVLLNTTTSSTNISSSGDCRSSISRSIEAVQSGVRGRVSRKCLGASQPDTPACKHRHRRDCLCDVQQSSEDCILHQCITTRVLLLPALSPTSPTDITFTQGRWW